MSLKLQNLVRYYPFGDPVTKAVALALVNCCRNDEGKNIYPTIKYLMQITDCKERNLRTHIRKLEQTNVIRRTRTGAGKTPNQWELTREWIKLAEQNLRKQKPNTDAEPPKPAIVYTPFRHDKEAPRAEPPISTRHDNQHKPNSLHESLATIKTEHHGLAAALRNWGRSIKTERDRTNEDTTNIPNTQRRGGAPT